MKFCEKCGMRIFRNNSCQNCDISLNTSANDISEQCYDCGKSESKAGVLFTVQRDSIYGRVKLCRDCYSKKSEKESNSYYQSTNKQTSPPPKKPRKFKTTQRLDSQQEKAVQYQFDRPLVIRAGPGAGKTRVVVERIKDIICQQDVKASRILCLSFSKNAQIEMLERFEKDNDLIKNNIRINKNNVMTIHSLAMKIISTGNVVQSTPPRDREDKWYSQNLKKY